MKTPAASYKTQESQVAFVSHQISLDGRRGLDPPDSEEYRNADTTTGGVSAKFKHIYHNFLHSMTAFTLIYACGLCFFGMSVSYTNSVLISIERRFGFSTKQIGMILAATELGHICMALLVAHFVGTKNRPLWICFGTVLMGAAVLLFASPEIIFPMTYVVVGNSSHNNGEHMCRPDRQWTNQTSAMDSEHCQAGGSGVAGPIIVFCIAHILVGFGSTTPMVLGMPYIDDNVSPASVPLYFGVALFFRLIGPLIGFGLGAICNSYFHDMSRPSINPSDPGWISAWYLGFLVVGGGLFLFGILIACFPSSMHESERPLKNRECNLIVAHVDPTNCEEKVITTLDGAPVVTAAQKHKSVVSSASWKELLHNLKRLFVNFTFLCRTTSMFVDGMIVAGFFNYFPKFYAQQFQLSQTSAALYGGLGGVVFVVLGVVTGSVSIKKFHLRPRSVGLMLVIPSFIMAMGSFISSGIGCGNIDIQGLPSAAEFRAGRGDFNDTFCPTSSHCGCLLSDFKPVCEQFTQTMFYSACHAGCQHARSINQTMFYEGCSCAASLPDFNSTDRPLRVPKFAVPDVRGGLCPKSCPNFGALTAVLFISVFFVGIPMSGQVMIQFRLVDVDLKNLCAGVTSVCVAAFGLLPGPIFVGAIVDSTCRLWQIRECGERGACMIYDNDQLRWKFFVTCGFLKIITLILDSIVTWRIWNMEFDRLADLDASCKPVQGIEKSDRDPKSIEASSMETEAL